jgi:hypothetical protein
MRSAGSEPAVGALPLSPCARCRQHTVRGASSPARERKGLRLCVVREETSTGRWGFLRARTLAQMSPSIQSPSTHLAPVGRLSAQASPRICVSLLNGLRHGDVVLGNPQQY